jgi:hypothetical protein
MILQIWSQLELMRLFNSKKAALVLTDLQKFEGVCDEQARRIRDLPLGVSSAEQYSHTPDEKE